MVIIVLILIFFIRFFTFEFLKVFVLVVFTAEYPVKQAYTQLK